MGVRLARVSRPRLFIGPATKYLAAIGLSPIWTSPFSS